MQKQFRHVLPAVVVLLAMTLGVAKPALAQINSLSFKGFNYVSYYNGGYANANSLPALAGTGANAVALSFEYGIDVKNSAVYAIPTTPTVRQSSPQPSWKRTAMASKSWSGR